MQSLEKAESIVLIGMPGAGKSTLGRSLAERFNKTFVDTDLLIEDKFGQSLQSLVDEKGYQQMRLEEGAVVLDHKFPADSVIATGGSVVYSHLAMQKLRSIGKVVYLSLTLNTINERVNNWQTRGFSAAPGQSLKAIFAEREVLYKKFAHCELDCGALNQEQALVQLAKIADWV